MGAGLLETSTYSNSSALFNSTPLQIVFGQGGCTNATPRYIPDINTYFILQIWTSLTIGCTLAILVTCIPLPVIPTAYRELTMRMRFIARQTRREITAIVLLISEYHNTHLNQGYDHVINGKDKKNSTSDDNDNGIEISANTYRNDIIHHHSTSFEDLKDDHLLKSDILDLNSLVNDELKHMQRALHEISYEPYFILLKLLNLIRSLLRHIPFIKNHIKTPSTLQTRLSVWTTGFASIQRIISGMLSLDHHHHAFVGQRQLINVSFFVKLTYTFEEKIVSGCLEARIFGSPTYRPSYPPPPPLTDSPPHYRPPHYKEKKIISLTIACSESNYRPLDIIHFTYFILA